MIASGSSVSTMVQKLRAWPMTIDLRDVRADRLEHALDVARRDVLAAGGLDEVLLAVGDLQEAVGVDLTDVAGLEEAVGGEAVRRSPRAGCGSRA